MAQSNGGTFDVESVAIMMMVLMFYFFVRAIKKGSMVDSVLAAGVYGSLSVTWEQYSLVGNMLALFVLLVILSNNFSLRCYVAYSTFYCLCALCTLSVSIMSLGQVPNTCRVHEKDKNLVIGKITLGVFLNLRNLFEMICCRYSPFSFFNCIVLPTSPVGKCPHHLTLTFW